MARLQPWKRPRRQRSPAGEGTAEEDTAEEGTAGHGAAGSDSAADASTGASTGSAPGGTAATVTTAPRAHERTDHETRRAEPVREDRSDADAYASDHGPRTGAAGQEPARPGAATRLRRSVADSAPVALVAAAHPKQTVVFALAMGAAALLAERPLREAAVVLATVLVGQTVLGWHNDLVDREHDRVHQTPGKPLADGRLDTGSVWYALTVAVLVLVPLSISTGVTAGTVYLVSLVVGLLGNVMLRRGVLSWVPWAASFALYPAYLSYGGWGGEAQGEPPTFAITALAALLGVGVHFVRSIWGLVADDEDGWTYLPLRLGRRIGATRLLVLATAYTTVVVAAMVAVGTTVGLRQ